MRLDKLLSGEDSDFAAKTFKSEMTLGDAIVSDSGNDNRLGLFRCKPLDLQQIINSKQAIISLKK